MGQSLVEPGPDPDPAGIAGFQRAECLLGRDIARPEDGELHPEGHRLVGAAQQQVEPFLRHEPADDADHRDLRRRVECEVLAQRGAVVVLAGQRLGAIPPRDQRIVRGVPEGRVDAVQDADEIARAPRQEPLEPEAERLVLDLAGVAGAHRRDPVGHLQAALQERHVAVVLDTVHPVDVPRESEARQHLRRTESLVREVVDRQDRPGTHAAEHVEVGRREARLPVVAVEDVRPPLERRRFVGQHRGRARQQREADVVVRPVAAGRLEIRSAGTIEQRVAREDVQRDAVGHRRGEQRRPRERREVEFGDDLGPAGRVREHGRVAGHEQPDIDAFAAERGGQGTAHVTEPPGLHEGGGFGGGEQDFHGGRA